MGLTWQGNGADVDPDPLARSPRHPPEGDKQYSRRPRAQSRRPRTDGV